MLSKTAFDGVGKMVWGSCGAGIALEYPPRPSHAVGAGCGAAVEGGWG